MSRFVLVDQDTALPPSVQEWLPEGHLARYVVDVVEALDLSALVRASTIAMTSTQPRARQTETS